MGSVVAHNLNSQFATSKRSRLRSLSKNRADETKPTKRVLLKLMMVDSTKAYSCAIAIATSPKKETSLLDPINLAQSHFLGKTIHYLIF
jgi:hypothetical protein